MVPVMASTKNEMSAGPNPSTKGPLISTSTIGILSGVRIDVYAFLQRAVKDHRDQENPQVAGLGLAHDLQALKPMAVELGHVPYIYSSAADHPKVEVKFKNADSLWRRSGGAG
jgi:hypothetical protein